MNDRLLREYRLGRLTKAQRHEIEERAFEDDSFEEKIRDAEYDLLDDWSRGKLSAEDAKAVERGFSAEQLAIARTIRAKSSPARRNWWPLAAVAAIVLCLVPSVYFWKESSRLRLELQSKSQQPPPLAPAGSPQIAALALHVPSTRGGAAGPVLTIPATAAMVQVTLDVEGGYDDYEVRVEAFRRGLIFSESKPASPDGLVVTIDAQAIPAGSYDFVVSGRKNGASTLLATYSCVIRVR